MEYLTDERVANISEQIDIAILDNDISTLQRLLQECYQLESLVDDMSKFQLWFCLGNINSQLEVLMQGTKISCYVDKQFEYYRKAIYGIEEKLENFGTGMTSDNSNEKKYILQLYFQVITNYGNILSKNYLFIQAIAQYNKVLKIGTFGMALGNLAIELEVYSSFLSDSGHQQCFWWTACQILLNTVNRSDIYPEAKPCFESHLQQYPKAFIKTVSTESMRFDDYTCSDLEEQKYREWSIVNGLFLNPLNDLPFSETAFQQDCLVLPNITTSISECLPDCFPILNQIKQEYVSARFMYYSSISNFDGVHYSDKETKLLIYSELPYYSLYLEQLKSSFRILFSLFDKCAFLINNYYKLGIKEKDVSFSNIWKCEKGGKNGYTYKKKLLDIDNYCISSLYEVYNDIILEKSIREPKQKQLKFIRNAIEHRCLLIFDSEEEINCSTSELPKITRKELESNTLFRMKIVRESIIYMTLSIRIEENKKNLVLNQALSMQLHEYLDDLKL